MKLIGYVLTFVALLILMPNPAVFAQEGEQFVSTATLESLMALRYHDTASRDVRWAAAFLKFQFTPKIGGQVAFDFEDTINGLNQDPTSDQLKRLRLFYDTDTRLGKFHVDFGRQLTRNEFGHIAPPELPTHRWPVTNNSYAVNRNGVTVSLGREKVEFALAYFEEGLPQGSFSWKTSHGDLFIWVADEEGSGFTWTDVFPRTTVGADAPAGDGIGVQGFVQHHVVLSDKVKGYSQVDFVDSDVYPMVGLTIEWRYRSLVRAYYDWYSFGGASPGWKVEVTRWFKLGKLNIKRRR